MMKVYSWNVCYFVRDVEAIANAIRMFEFDVLCLQEVSEELLTLLKEMPFELAYDVESVRYERRGEVPVYVAILSKQPIRERGRIRFTDPRMPFRTKLFIWGTFLGWTFVKDRGAVYADIETEEGMLRVVSLHLSTLFGAENRRAEFRDTVRQTAGPYPRVIAGDFNIIEWGPIKLLNWLLGGPLPEALPWYPERHRIEVEFKGHGFHNPHRERVTHAFSRSQLDHIIAERPLVASREHVHAEIGISDHYPISAVITPAQ